MEATTRSTEPLKDLLRSSAELTVLMDDHGAVQFVGSAITPLLGHDPLALIGSPVISLVAESHAERLASLIQRALGGREASGSDMPFLRFDGREVALDLRISPLVEISGASAEGALLSLTESVTTGLLDLALRGDERRLALLLPDAPLPVLRLDDTGHCFAANPAWCALTRREESRETGAGWLDLVHDADAASIRNLLRQARESGQGFRHDLDLERGAGDVRKVEVGYAPVPGGGLLVAVDLTLPEPIAKRAKPTPAAATAVPAAPAAVKATEPAAAAAAAAVLRNVAAVAPAPPVAMAAAVPVPVMAAAPRRDERGPLAAQPETSLQHALAAVLAASRVQPTPVAPVPLPVVEVVPVVDMAPVAVEVVPVVVELVPVVDVVAPVVDVVPVVEVVPIVARVATATASGTATGGKMSAFMASRQGWDDTPRTITEALPVFITPEDVSSHTGGGTSADGDVVLQPPRMRQPEVTLDAVTVPAAVAEVQSVARTSVAVIEPVKPLFGEPRSAILHAPDLRAPHTDRDTETSDEPVVAAPAVVARPMELNYADPPGVEPVSELVNTSEFVVRVGAARERAASQGMSLCIVRFELADYATKHKMYENTHMFILARRMVSCIRELDVAGRIGPAGFGVTGVGWFFPGDLERMIVRIYDRIKEDLPTTDDPVMPDFCVAGVLGAPDDDDLTTMNRSQELLTAAFAKGPGHVMFDEAILGA